ncbi:HNH endonuclease [Rhodobacteraceae bacterium B1Z28]|uniref:HNH endonuclease n=1 Tax=Ruegeria haliotis TaxID=2747601 RepID=A0ABX2PPR6_9RHOB|nr:ABC-three component system protein [Ruegeria haliotis]NVO56028.1 HNH endonuclease [Ruegeria haliotis]
MSNKRRNLSNAQQLALISQVDRVCPLDAEPLFYTKGQKSYKNYEIAHIYPLNPTPSEETLLQYEERLGKDVNDEDNLIPLCSLCHTQYDKPRTIEEYRELVAIKKRAMERSGQEQLWKKHHIEEGILEIVDAIYSDADEDIEAEIIFTSVKVDEKLNDSISKPTRRKIKSNVSYYYTFVREKLALLDLAGDCTSEIISSQVKTFYLTQKSKGVSQQAVFENIVNWLDAKTKSETKDAAEIIASFFIQNCEVFE